MTIIQITIDESLPLAKFKTALSLIRGVSRIEVLDAAVCADKEDYKQLKSAFLHTSKLSMASKIKKYV
jgi:hypothetical protein